MNNNSIIGKVVRNEDLYRVAEGITRKALKVMEAKGNNFARDIIEKNLDIMQDLKQEVVINIIENNYIVKKDAFQVVNNYLYNKETKIKQFEKISIETEDKNDIELLNYISFLEYNDKKIMIENEKQEKSKDIINMLNLTDRQKEILDIYCKIQNAQKTANLLGINCNTVKTTIKRIREKTKKLDIQIA